MDFYTNIHKSRGDRGSSITASSDTVSPFNYSTRGRGDRKRTAEAALKAEAARWRRVGTRMRENLAELDRAASGSAAGCPASGSMKVRAAWAAPPERTGRGTGGAAAEPCGPTPPPPRPFANTYSRERSGPGHSQARGYDEATTSRVGRESSAP
nr:uncharacterized protein LOC101028608 [Saimiri boliviensis boliviensis]